MSAVPALAHGDAGRARRRACSGSADARGRAAGRSGRPRGPPVRRPCRRDARSRALRGRHRSREVYVTNAVKHFKFEPRGKRRLHAKPNAQEIQACSWWLRRRAEHVKPRLVIALGATAARSLLGRTVTIASMRGTADAAAPTMRCLDHDSPIVSAAHPRRSAATRGIRALRPGTGSRPRVASRPSGARRVTSSGRVEIRPPVAEHEPVVAQLRDRVEIERRGEHRVLALARLGDLRARLRRR